MAWPNATTNDDAIIGVGSGAAGTITVSGTVNVNDLTFNAPGSGSYLVSGGNLALVGTPIITTNSAARIDSGITNTATSTTFVGPGTLTLGGTANFTGQDIVLNGVSNTSSTLNVVSGANITAGNLFIRQQTGVANYTGNFIQTGGNTTISNEFQLGASTTGSGGSNISNATVSGGVLNTGTLRFYKWAASNFTVSNSGVVNATNISLGWVDSAPTGSINLGDGTTFSGGTSINDGGTSGILNTGSFTFFSNRNYSLNFKGGTVKASAASSSWMPASTFTSATVQEAGGIIDNGGYAITIGQNLTHGGVAAIDGGLVFKGGATTTLTGSNSYTGTTNITAGTLQVGSGGATGSLGSGNVINNAALVYNLTGNYSINNNISGNGTVSNTGVTGAVTFAKNITLTNNNFTFTTLGGSISTGANLSVGTGAGTITSTGSNFTIGGTNSLSASGAGSITIAGTAATGGGGNAGIVLSGSSLTTSGAINLRGQNTGEWGINYSTSGSILATSGITTLTGTTTNNGAGKSPFLFINNPTITLTANPGATIVLQGGTSTGTSNSIFNDYNGATVFNTTGNVQFIAGVTSSTNSFWGSQASLNAGAPTFNVGANSTLMLDAGVTSMTNGLKVGSMGANSSVTIAGSGTGTMSGSKVLTNLSNTLEFNLSGTGALLHSGLVSGAGGITKSGTGTLVLSGTNTYGGGTVVRQGTLQLASAAAATATGLITLGDASSGASAITLSANAGSANFANPITVSASGTGPVTIRGDQNYLTFTGLMTLNRATTIDGNAGDRFGISGRITGNVGTLTINAPRVTFEQSAGNANDFIGNVVINAGKTLQLNTPYGLNATHAVTANGVLRVISGANTTVNIGTLTGTGFVNGDTGGSNFLKTLSLGGDNGSGTFSGIISNGGGGDTLAITKTGTGMQTLATSSVNTYTGTTTVNRGTLELDGSIDNSGLVVMNATGGGLTTPGDATLLINQAGPRQLGNTSFGTGDVIVGQTSFGLLQHDAGTTVVGRNLQVGQSTGSNGRVDLNGGTMTINGRLLVGGGATGGQAMVNVNPGSTLNVNGNTTIVDSPTGPLFGTLNLSGGTFNEANDMIVGQAATGIVNHTAGLATVQGNLTVGQSGSTAGTYNLSGTGELNFNDTASPTQSTAGLTQSTITIGPNGQFNFTGGTLANVATIDASLAPDQDPGAAVRAGTFLQEGGRFVIGVDGLLNTATAVRAETDVIGDFAQTGGTLAIDIFGADGVYGSGEVGNFPAIVQTDSDLLNVTGDLLLNGTLAINTNGVQPPAFGWYDVAYANTIQIGMDFNLTGVGLYQVIDNPTGSGQILQVAAPEPAAILAWLLVSVIGFGVWHRFARRK